MAKRVHHLLLALALLVACCTHACSASADPGTVIAAAGRNLASKSDLSDHIENEGEEEDENEDENEDDDAEDTGSPDVDHDGAPHSPEAYDGPDADDDTNGTEPSVPILVVDPVGAVGGGDKSNDDGVDGTDTDGADDTSTDDDGTDDDGTDDDGTDDTGIDDGTGDNIQPVLGPVAYDSAPRSPRSPLTRRRTPPGKAGNEVVRHVSPSTKRRPPPKAKSTRRKQPPPPRRRRRPPPKSKKSKKHG